MIRIQEVRSHKTAIMRIVARYGIQHVRIFGSPARGNETAGDDVDLLVDFEQGRSLLNQVGFEQDVTALLGCKVEVVAEGGISPYLQKNILDDAVPL
jgi:predicted nucleotidyltransferase